MIMEECRKKIDVIDQDLVRLFVDRMKTTQDIAAYKKENKLPILDPARERAKLDAVEAMAGSDMADYTGRLYQTIFDLSKSYQRRVNRTHSALRDKVQEAMADTPQAFPTHATVACQGVEGSYGLQAAETIFERPNVMFFNAFEGVFAAVDQGLCRYGVLPLENSSAGSVSVIYDLMMKYDFHIVRSARVKIDHTLLANRGVKLEEVREVFSHEQALMQSEHFLKSLGDVKITAVENTAAAAKAVAESGRKDAAAISQRYCADLYGLEVLREGVQDYGNNATRFICISKKLEIYPGADRTSIMMTLPHEPGALYRILGRFYALNINLTKLESRPLPDSDFEFMFYFDLATSIYHDRFLQLFEGLDELSSQFKYLGSYSEVK